MSDKARPWRDTPVEWVGAGGSTRKPETACKHDDGPCETCGTASYSDRGHTTRNGVGCVEALRRGPMGDGKGAQIRLQALGDAKAAIDAALHATAVVSGTSRGRRRDTALEAMALLRAAMAELVDLHNRLEKPCPF